MINVNLTIDTDGTTLIVDLPDSPPPIEVVIKATMSCQFDNNATTTITEKIREKYGEEYFRKTMQAMSEVIKTFREVIQNSMALDPESPAVPVIYMSPRGQK